MIMMGLKFMGEVPFRDVYIHALIRDAEGQKMSKTKGNVIDPLQIMEQYGTDALRFTLAAFAAQGRDIKLAEDRIEGYRNFCNKLWNASRFAFMNLEDYKGSCALDENANFSTADRWILSRLNRATKDVNEALEAFRFNDAALTVYKFIWNEYCDWYIELTKSKLFKPGEGRAVAQNVLIHVLDSALKLLHPFMPFITEEIWQKLPQNEESIMVSSFPEYRESYADEAIESEMAVVMEVITGIRNIRGEMNLNPGLKLNVLVKTKNPEIQKILQAQGAYIKELARVEHLETGSDIEKPKVAASSVLGEMDLIIPLEGMMDFQEERNRVEKELKKIEKDLIFLNKKLSNPNFVKKAPAEVIEKDEQRKTTLSEKQAKLEIHLKTIEQGLC
jgi:valyl-tRNA synthetase